MHSRDTLVEVEHNRVNNLSTGESQQLPGKPGRALGRSLYLLKIGASLRLARKARIFHDDLNVAQYNRKHVVKVMGNSTRQTPHSLHLLSLTLMLLQLDFLGNVTRNAHEVDYAPILIMHGGNAQILHVGSSILLLTQEAPPPYPAGRDRLPRFFNGTLVLLGAVQQTRIPAQHFLASVPGYGFKGGVYILNGPVQVGDNDHFRDLLNSRSQPSPLPLRPLSFADIDGETLNDVPLAPLLLDHRQIHFSAISPARPSYDPYVPDPSTHRRPTTSQNPCFGRRDPPRDRRGAHRSLRQGQKATCREGFGPWPDSPQALLPPH